MNSESEKISIKTDSQWDFEILNKQTKLVRRKIALPGTHSGFDAYGSYWMFGYLNVDGGRYLYNTNGETVPLQGIAYGLFAPKYSLISSTLVDANVSAVGIISSSEIATKFKNPIIFFGPIVEQPMSCRNVEIALKKVRDPIDISVSSNPSPIAAKVKKAIDEVYTMPYNLDEIARNLRISQSSMTQHFKQHYKLTPSAYRKNMRAIHAAMTLMNGASITDTAFDTGYSDLSRFYKQFKSITTTSPGSYSRSKK